MSNPTEDRSVSILSENAGEVRLYIVQYWCERRNRRVREYADAVPPQDLATMGEEDRAKVLYAARENLSPTPLPKQAATCAHGDCNTCKSGCSSH
jgi:hypothetical protein